MQRLFLTASVIFIAMATPAMAGAQTAACAGQAGIVPDVDTQVLCTRLIDFKGTCGIPNIPGVKGYENVAIYINPWEDHSITLRQVQVSTVLFGPLLNGQPQPANLNIGIYAGNSYNSNQMTPYKYGYAFGGKVIILDTENTFPAGTGMEFPGKENSATTGPHGDRIDVHVDCGPAGASYVGKWFLGYTVNRSH